MSNMIRPSSRDHQPVKLRIALVTADEARELDLDLPSLEAALRERGADATALAWDDPAADWSGFDAAVLRSTWDYVDRIDEFLEWCDHCASRTRLFNPPALVRWNTDKHYLLDLARRGVPVVPTRFVEPGENPEAALAAFLGGGEDCVTVGRAGRFTGYVAKPAIGSGSRDAARFARGDVDAAGAHVRRLLEAGRSVLLQPYLERVDQAGETAVLYFGGSYSHAARKGPLLAVGGPPVEGLFAPEEMQPREPTAAELEVAAAAYAAIPFAPPVYARIDLLQDEQGAPVVLELELTEPSLFFPQAPGAAERFASHLMRVAAPTR
jgi:glutathione synthase/RimK-type ligase-like ATP-grasp enzyme